MKVCELPQRAPLGLGGGGMKNAGKIQENRAHYNTAILINNSDMVYV